MNLVCAFCGVDMAPTELAYVRVEGWERPGRGAHGRSGSSLVLRRVVPGEAAHIRCVSLAQAGVDTGQLELEATQ